MRFLSGRSKASLGEVARHLSGRLKTYRDHDLACCGCGVCRRGVVAGQMDGLQRFRCCPAPVVDL
jgi:hypothetical protein